MLALLYFSLLLTRAESQPFACFSGYKGLQYLLVLLTFLQAVGTTSPCRLRLIVPLQDAQELCLHLLNLMLYQVKILKIWIYGCTAVVPFSAHYKVGRVGSVTATTKVVALSSLVLCRLSTIRTLSWC